MGDREGVQNPLALMPVIFRIARAAECFVVLVRKRSILLCFEGAEAVTLAEERGGITLTAIQRPAGLCSPTHGPRVVPNWSVFMPGYASRETRLQCFPGKLPFGLGIRCHDCHSRMYGVSD